MVCGYDVCGGSAQMIYQVHNVCAEQGELLADVLSEQYGELADQYEESVETTELHRIDAMMSALRGCAGAAAHATAPTLQRHDPLTLAVRAGVVVACSRQGPQQAAR